ncbi:MAG: 4Fe-4S binding protein [Planctomycetota bacterium]|jgi:Fe-S-cluster-containing dehydrogenase component
MVRLAVADAEKCVGCQSCMFACARREKVAGLGKSRIGVRSTGGMEHGFTVIVCRACDDPPCAKACPNDALELRKGGGVKLDEAKCLGCGTCRSACILGAVFREEDELKPMICIHCGYCVKFCPHGVLEMEKKGGGDEQ